MKTILFTWLISYYLSQHSIKASDSIDGDDDGWFSQLVFPDEARCPCWPRYVQDILGICSRSAVSDQAIECEIAGDSFLGGVPIVACFSDGNDVPDFLEPLFVDVRFGDAPFGICLNAPRGIFDILRIIIQIIRALADIFDDICDDDRRRLKSAESSQAFAYMVELMEFTPSATTGPEGRAERDRLTRMVFKEGGLAEITMQMVREYEQTRGSGKNRRNLLDDDDGPDICPFRFLQFLLGGDFDPDENPFEFILDELESAVDDVDCDDEEAFFDAPIECIIKQALDGDIEDGDSSGLPQPILAITFDDQVTACREDLTQAATTLDENIDLDGCGGNDPCTIPDPDTCVEER